MADDLVKRLRGWPAVIKAESIMLEAADRIEALTAERDALTAEVERLREARNDLLQS